MMPGGKVMKAKSGQYLEICLVFIAELIVVMIAPLLVSLAESNPTKMLMKYLLCVLMVGVVIMACRMQKKPVFSVLGFSKTHISKQLLIAIPVFAVTVFLFVIVPLLFGVEKTSWLGSKSINLSSAILYVIQYMLFVGPGEEIIFRGYLLERIHDMTGSGIKAVIISSVLFGVWHFPVGQDFLQVLLTTLIGMTYGFARLKLNNCTTLSVGIAHGLHDTFILFLGRILL